jgi:hypothetical protein
VGTLRHRGPVVVHSLPGVRLSPAERRACLMYDSAPVFRHVYGALAQHGFAPIAFEGVLDDAETGEMLQADGIFRRWTGSSLATTEIR